VSKQVYLLDTSAIITFLEDENGADRVKTIVREEKAFLPFPVLLEIYYISCQEQSEAVADWRYALLKQWPVTILWDADEPTILTAGRFKAYNRVSLADALIAAFAHRHRAILVHKDPEMEALSGLVRQEILPYK
jgi:predicted nucleic acid-binding protein